LPGHGIHYLSYKRRFIQVERQREKQVIQRNGVRVPLETVTLTTLGLILIFKAFNYFYRYKSVILEKFPSRSD
jgi:hypothetical protein